MELTVKSICTRGAYAAVLKGDRSCHSPILLSGRWSRMRGRAVRVRRGHAGFQTRVAPIALPRPGRPQGPLAPASRLCRTREAPPRKRGRGQRRGRRPAPRREAGTIAATISSCGGCGRFGIGAACARGREDSEPPSPAGAAAPRRRGAGGESRARGRSGGANKAPPVHGDGQAARPRRARRRLRLRRLLAKASAVGAAAAGRMPRPRGGRGGSRAQDLRGCW